MPAAPRTVTPMDPQFARLRLGRLVAWPVAGLAAVLLGALAPPRTGHGTTIVTIAYVVFPLLLIAGLSACRSAGIPPAAVIGPLPRGARSWVTATLLALLVLLAGALLAWTIVAAAAGIAPDWAAERLARKDGPGFLDRVEPTQRLLLAASIVLVGPVVEEFVFRGLLLRRWVARRGFWPGILGSAAVFAALHPHNLPSAFLSGVVLGILYLWSRSLLVPILAHVLNNGLVVASLGNAASRSGSPPVQTVGEVRAEWPIPVIGLLLVAPAIVALLYPLVRETRACAAA